MFTRDSTNNYNHNFSNASGGDYNEVELEFGNIEAISQRETNNSDTFDNNVLSQKFGQASIEKAILLLFLIISLSGAILYYYWHFFKVYYIRLILISSSVDLLLLLFYGALRIRFNSNEPTTSFNNQFYYFMDFVLIINFLLKSVIFVLYFFYKINLSSIFIFSGKYLLEIYLLLSCIKMIIFCPGYKKCIGIFEIVIGWFKYLFVCFDNQDNREYNRSSDDSSDYNILNSEVLEE